MELLQEFLDLVSVVTSTILSYFSTVSVESTVSGLLTSLHRNGVFGKYPLFIMITRPNNGIVVYPEGHRFKGEGSLPLKTGVLEVAYNLKVPCQCVLATGKVSDSYVINVQEDLLDEINLRVQTGQTLTVCVSDVLHPEEYKTKEEWFEAVRSTWNETLTTLNKKQGVKEVEGVLPGVDKEKCCDEPVLPEHAAISWAVVIALCAIIFYFH